MKVKLLFLLVLLAGFSTISCSPKEPPKDPVTDPSYFQKKLGKLAEDLMKKASHHPKKGAILDFVNGTNGKTSQFGKYLTSKFTEITVAKNLFIVPSEGEISRTLKQLNLPYNGTMDSASAKKLGDALGCDALIVGTVSDLQKGVDIDLVVKIIDAKNGTVISASSSSFFRSKQISSMLESY